ncbi:hypothetical protein [Rhizobium phaseoli]|uniref:hypothetical protein n=1 Tax=Rhizobium phaseoli TaxID=396 RepID=UPI001142A2E2|nr:hypothetical protein [Rhizobium phaseoli]
MPRKAKAASLPDGIAHSVQRRGGTHAAVARNNLAATADRMPLRRTDEDGMVKYSVVERSQANAGFDYLRMELPAQRFRQAQPTALPTG